MGCSRNNALRQPLTRCADSVCTREAITRPCARAPRGASAWGSAGRGKQPANRSISAPRLTRAYAIRVEAARRTQGVRVYPRDPVLHLLAEARKGVVAEFLETRHVVDQAADVLEHGVAEHQRLAVLVLLQPLGDALDRLAQSPVRVGGGIVRALPDDRRRDLCRYVALTEPPDTSRRWGPKRSPACGRPTFLCDSDVTASGTPGAGHLTAPFSPGRRTPSQAPVPALRQRQDNVRIRPSADQSQPETSAPELREKQHRPSSLVLQSQTREPVAHLRGDAPRGKLGAAVEPAGPLMRVRHDDHGPALETHIHCIEGHTAEDPNPETTRSLLRLMLASGADD